MSDQNNNSGVVAQWIKFRKSYIENILTPEEREAVFPETLEPDYDWEAGGLRDYILVNMPRVNE